jgi:RNA polymerase sigma factor (sigma-70 family)
MVRHTHSNKIVADLGPSDTRTAPTDRPEPSDEALVIRAARGDAEALSQLMARYDRLVRYTVLRTSRRQCLQDPQWLDSVASDAWMGFVRSMQLDSLGPPRSVAGYLVLIARNRCISALRALPSPSLPDRDSQRPSGLSSHEEEDPAEVLARLELLEALKDCVGRLDPGDALAMSQLSLITSRKWTLAADRLGWGESTLRSRWKQILVRLRDCVAEKSGEAFAPQAAEDDF